MLIDHAAEGEAVEHVFKQGLISSFAAFEKFPRLALAQSQGDHVGDIFKKGEQFRIESPFGVVVELESECFAARVQADQGYRLVAEAIAPVPGAGLAVCVRCRGKKIRGAVGPEAAFCREK